MVSQFYIREGQGDWNLAKATSLTGAKREATRNQMFCGSDLYVGERFGNTIVKRAAKFCPGISMAEKGFWQSIDPDHITGGYVKIYD